MVSKFDKSTQVLSKALVDPRVTIAYFEKNPPVFRVSITTHKDWLYHLNFGYKTAWETPFKELLYFTPYCVQMFFKGKLLGCISKLAHCNL